MVYNGYYKVMFNIPKMGQLPTPERSTYIYIHIYCEKKTATASLRPPLIQRSCDSSVAGGCCDCAPCLGRMVARMTLGPFIFWLEHGGICWTFGWTFGWNGWNGWNTMEYENVRIPLTILPTPLLIRPQRWRLRLLLRRRSRSRRS